MIQPFDSAELIGGPDKIAGHCLNCDRDSSFKTVVRSTTWPRNAGLGYTDPSRYPRADLAVWVCLYCSNTMITVESYDADRNIEVVYAWPKFVPQELPMSVPEPARGLYFEGSQSASVGARRAAAGAFRATVEAVVKDKGASGGDLKSRINALDHPCTVRTGAGDDR